VGMHCRRIAVALIVATCATAQVSFADCHPGRGVSLFHDKLTIGGYVAVNASFLDETRDTLMLDDLSAFVTLHLTDRWLVFAEAELEDPVHVESGGFATGSDVFSLERLYSEWQPNDRLRLRVGQMLTPFGIWNLIHAQPLVWTTSRPIATADFFDTGVTGFEATVFAPVSRVDVSVTAYGQVTPHVDETDDPQEAHRAVGARIDAGVSGLRVGASAAYFREHEDRRDETAAGVDAMWTARYVELSTEIALNVPDSGDTTGAGYVQAVLHAPWTLHPFVRVEYADLGSYDRVPVVFGLAWKPTDATIVKLEGIVGGHDTSLGGDGVLASYAVLF